MSFLLQFVCSKLPLFSTQIPLIVLVQAQGLTLQGPQLSQSIKMSGSKSQAYLRIGLSLNSICYCGLLVYSLGFGVPWKLTWHIAVLGGILLRTVTEV